MGGGDKRKHLIVGLFTVSEGDYRGREDRSSKYGTRAIAKSLVLTCKLYAVREIGSRICF